MTNLDSWPPKAPASLKWQQFVHDMNGLGYTQQELQEMYHKKYSGTITSHVTPKPQFDRYDYTQFRIILRGAEIPIKEINKLWGAYKSALISNDDVEEYAGYYYMMQKQSQNRHSKYEKYIKKLRKKNPTLLHMDLEKWKLKRKRWLTSNPDNYALTQY